MSYFTSIPKRLLIIRLSSIGDITLSSMLIRLLRKRFRKAVIDMIVHERYISLLNGFDRLDHRLGYPENSRERKQVRRKLKQTGYDTIIDLQNNIISRKITQSTGAYRVFRFNRPRINRWIRIHLPGLRERLRSPDHVALNYVKCAMALKLKDDGVGLDFNVPAAQVEKVRTDLEAYNISCGLQPDTAPLIIAPGARHYTKRWLTDKWKDFLQQAYDKGFRSQVIIGDQDDVAVAEHINGHLQHSTLTVAGKYDLLESAALIDLGCALISNDSAPMHLASAVGTPVVAIFGSTVEEFGFAPFRCSSRTVQVDDLECRPCRPHGSSCCPKDHFKCMENISSESVLDELSSLLQQTDKPAEAGVIEVV